MSDRYWELYERVAQSARYCFNPRTDLQLAEGHLTPVEYEEFQNIYNALLG